MRRALQSLRRRCQRQHLSRGCGFPANYASFQWQISLRATASASWTALRIAQPAFRLNSCRYHLLRAQVMATSTHCKKVSPASRGSNRAGSWHRSVLNEEGATGYSARKRISTGTEVYLSGRTRTSRATKQSQRGIPRLCVAGVLSPTPLDPLPPRAAWALPDRVWCTHPKRQPIPTARLRHADQSRTHRLDRGSPWPAGAKVADQLGEDSVCRDRSHAPESRRTSSVKGWPPAQGRSSGAS